MIYYYIKKSFLFTVYFTIFSLCNTNCMSLYNKIVKYIPTATITFIPLVSSQQILDCFDLCVKPQNIQNFTDCFNECKENITIPKNVSFENNELVILLTTVPALTFITISTYYCLYKKSKLPTNDLLLEEVK